MTGEDAKPAAYEASGGYQPAGGGISVLGFIKVLLILVAWFAANELIGRYFGYGAASALANLVLGGSVILIGSHTILNAERFEGVHTPKDARRARFWGIPSLMLGTAIVTLALRSFEFLWEGW